MMTMTNITAAAAAAADPPTIMAVVDESSGLVMLLAVVAVDVPGSLAAVVPEVAGWPELVMTAV